MKNEVYEPGDVDSVTAAVRAAATKTAAALQFSGSSFTVFTPVVTHQNAHPADVPETRASLMAVERDLGWKPRIFFPNEAVPDVKKV